MPAPGQDDIGLDRRSQLREIPSGEVGTSRTIHMLPRLRMDRSNCSLVSNPRQLQSLANDLRLGEIDERCVDLNHRFPLHSGFGCKVCESLEGVDELWTTIRVSAVVQSIDANENVAAFENLCPSQGE